MSAIPDPSANTPRAYPSGTVAFAFTDIEGSTQRWERDRSAMEEAVRRHDALMRETIEAHGGHVFKTIVDEIRVRAVVHVGTADERDGDYFGPTVNPIARLLAIGHGGQVLVSGVAADLMVGRPFQKPFARPPGKGPSSALVNVGWGASLCGGRADADRQPACGAQDANVESDEHGERR